MPLSPFALPDRLLAPAPAAARAGWLRDWRFAHRGLHGAAIPENSPAAFAGAIARGLGIECDIQLSRDGAAMVFHDDALDRLTAATGPVAARSAQELEQIALTGGADTIPTLRRVLELVAGQVPILIEIKSPGRASGGVERACAAVHGELAGYGGAHAVMSFDPRIVRWFAARSPQTVRGLVVTEEDDPGLVGDLRRHLWLWLARPDFLAYDIRDLPSRFAGGQRRRGLPLLTWTVRSADLLARARVWADAPIAEGAGLA